MSYKTQKIIFCTFRCGFIRDIHSHCQLIPGDKSDHLQRTRQEMLWRPARRKGGTPDCLSAAVHGPQASGAGPGEGRGGGRDLLLPILLLLFRGCRHALAMTKALSWRRYFCSTFHSNSGVSVSNNESTVLRFRHHSLNCHSLVI